MAIVPVVEDLLSHLKNRRQARISSQLDRRGNEGRRLLLYPALADSDVDIVIAAFLKSIRGGGG